MTLKTPHTLRSRVGLTAVLGLLALAFIPSSLAAPPGGGGGGGKGGKTCTRATPGVAVDNTWAWSQAGSWGMPGQTLTYAVNVLNNDVGCSSSSFVARLTGPDGFSVSLPTDTVTLSAGQGGYLWATVSSPASAVDGNYALTATVVRAGTSSPSGSFASWYKVYSADTTAPTLFWATPGEGSVVSGRSYTMSVSARDDHAVRTVELRLDGAWMSTTTCDGVSYTCKLYYSWAVTRGAHTATYTATDWMGNVASTTVSFSV